MRLCVGTRIHGVEPTPAFEAKLLEFVDRAGVYAETTLIAVKVDLEQNDLALYSFVKAAVEAKGNVVVVPVSTWGPGFTPALNALVQKALTVDATHILFQSLELTVAATDVDQIVSLCDSQTLVVGGRLPGHAFKAGSTVPANGRTVPWNTLAVWDARTLARTGFPMVADGLIPGTEAGVEEVSAIALAQTVSPSLTKAKLVTLKSVEWHTTFEHPSRQQAHEKKMSSKLSRPATHMSLFAPVVQDITKVEHVIQGHIGLKRKNSIEIPLYSLTVEDNVESKCRSNSMEEYQDDVKLPSPRSVSDQRSKRAGWFDNLFGSKTGKEEVSKKRKTVLVTGGAGFIGSNTAAALLKRGDNVVVVDEVNDYYDVQQKEENLAWLKTVSKVCEGFFTVVRGDICDEDLMKHTFDTYCPTHIVHLAARAGVRPSIQDPMIYVHSNVRGTTLLLELSRKHHCEHFVYASSSSVYGSAKQEIFRETDIVDSPVSPYAATKKACELMAATYSHLYNMPTAGLRFFTVYGPRGRPDMAPFMFIKRIFSGETINQFGDGTSERDYTYIDDIVSGVIGAVDNPHGCQVYNLGNGRPISLKRFIDIAAKCAGKKAVINVMPMQPGDVPRTCANIDKARKLIGYDPQVPFEQGMQRTADWFKSTVLKR
jgi:UDP-glucuronate 4-epimerase